MKIKEPTGPKCEARRPSSASKRRALSIAFLSEDKIFTPLSFWKKESYRVPGVEMHVTTEVT